MTSGDPCVRQPVSHPFGLFVFFGIGKGVMAMLDYLAGGGSGQVIKGLA